MDADPEQVVTRFLTSSKPKPVLYLGLILDRGSLDKLLAWWDKATGEPLLGKYIAHHVTIQFKPSAEQVAQAEVGKRHSVQVVGWASDDKAQAVIVSGINVAPGQIAHITLALAPGIAPAYSKELVRHSAKLHGPTLTGEVEAVMGH